MTTTPTESQLPVGGCSEERGAAPTGFAVVGGATARLLAGPVRADGAESLQSHERRLGELGLDQFSADALRQLIARSGLSGRGGGQFPTGRKLEAAIAQGGRALLVVNAAEGEPASRKDRTLLSTRPHLVLDGAAVAARAIRASEVVIYLHRKQREATDALEAALAERGSEHVPVRIVDAPARYVAGEASAVASYFAGRGALPRKELRASSTKRLGQPQTIVVNTETAAHLGLIVRHSIDWFLDAGGASCPGSTLVTLGGEVAVPGVVAEVLSPVAIGDLLSTLGGLDAAPAGVLLGGYAGAWIRGDVAWRTPVDRGALRGVGLSLGCGLIASLGPGSCGIATTSRLVNWLSQESAGQCGPCVLGLPSLAALLAALANGEASVDDLRDLRRTLLALDGRGACGHPSGVVMLVESALDTFSDEVLAHLKGRSCPPATKGFPIPRTAGGA